MPKIRGKVLEGARARWAIAVLAIVCSTCAGVASAARHRLPPIRLATPVVAQAPVFPLNGSFVAWTAQGLEQFSLENGAPLRRVLGLKGGSEVPEPSYAPGPESTIWLTLTSGPRRECRRCKESRHVPDSCSGEVLRFDPATGELTTERKFPSSMSIYGADVSPDGRWLLVKASECTNSFGNHSFENTHLLGINLESGAEWVVGAGAAACHELGSGAWNESGSEYVVPFGASSLPAGTTHGRLLVGGESCPAPHPAALAVLNTGSSSEFSHSALIEPPSGCSYKSAAFDSEGILAFAACSVLNPQRENRREPRRDYLVQLNGSEQTVGRVALEIGECPCSLASDPLTGAILVTQGGWVWEYHGGSLHLIQHYDEQQVAQPW